MRKIFLLIILPLAVTALATAQVPKGNIFAGYSFAKADVGGVVAGQRTNLNGWNASLEGKLFPFVGIVADVSGHYGSDRFSAPLNGTPLFTEIPGDARLLTAMFGPRVSVSVGKVRPFAEALFGVSHLRLQLPAMPDLTIPFPGSSASDTSFASAYGGGIDYHLLPFFAWRVEADALRTSFSRSTQNTSFRVSTGIVFNF